MAISRELAHRIIKTMDNTYYIYMLTSKNHKALYVGVTNDLIRRLNEHKSKTADGFTKKYNVSILVYYEEYKDVEIAIAREKQIKSWSRKSKTDLITQNNPNWEELEI